jgi:C-terminal processing protease CtpA/Prc
MDKLRDAKRLTRLGAMKLAPTLTKYVDERHKFYQKSEGLEESYNKALKTEENLAAKNIDNNFHGTADAPRTSTERKQWRQIMEHVDANLKGAGLDINHADKQALLWYLEQRLFQGPNAKSSMDYLDAAHVLTRKVKNGEI